MKKGPARKGRPPHVPGSRPPPPARSPAGWAEPGAWPCGRVRAPRVSPGTNPDGSQPGRAQAEAATLSVARGFREAAKPRLTLGQGDRPKPAAPFGSPAKDGSVANRVGLFQAVRAPGKRFRTASREGFPL